MGGDWTNETPRKKEEQRGQRGEVAATAEGGCGFQEESAAGDVTWA
jgi:hypothetical protein